MIWRSAVSERSIATRFSVSTSPGSPPWPTTARAASAGTGQSPSASSPELTETGRGTPWPWAAECSKPSSVSLTLARIQTFAAAPAARSFRLAVSSEGSRVEPRPMRSHCTEFFWLRLRICVQWRAKHGSMRTQHPLQSRAGQKRLREVHCERRFQARNGARRHRGRSRHVQQGAEGERRRASMGPRSVAERAGAVLDSCRDRGVRVGR